MSSASFHFLSPSSLQKRKWFPSAMKQSFVIATNELIRLFGFETKEGKALLVMLKKFEVFNTLPGTGHYVKHSDGAVRESGDGSPEFIGSLSDESLASIFTVLEQMLGNSRLAKYRENIQAVIKVCDQLKSYHTKKKLQYQGKYKEEKGKAEIARLTALIAKQEAKVASLHAKIGTLPPEIQSQFKSPAPAESKWQTPPRVERSSHRRRTPQAALSARTMKLRRSAKGIDALIAMAEKDENKILLEKIVNEIADAPNVIVRIVKQIELADYYAKRERLFDGISLSLYKANLAFISFLLEIFRHYQTIKPHRDHALKQFNEATEIARQGRDVDIKPYEKNYREYNDSYIRYKEILVNHGILLRVRVSTQEAVDAQILLELKKQEAFLQEKVVACVQHRVDTLGLLPTSADEKQAGEDFDAAFGRSSVHYSVQRINGLSAHHRGNPNALYRLSVAAEQQRKTEAKDWLVMAALHDHPVACLAMYQQTKADHWLKRLQHSSLQIADIDPQSSLEGARYFSMLPESHYGENAEAFFTKAAETLPVAACELVRYWHQTDQLDPYHIAKAKQYLQNIRRVQAEKAARRETKAMLSTEAIDDVSEEVIAEAERIVKEAERQVKYYQDAAMKVRANYIADLPESHPVRKFYWTFLRQVSDQLHAGRVKTRGEFKLYATSAKQMKRQAALFLLRLPIPSTIITKVMDEALDWYHLIENMEVWNTIGTYLLLVAEREGMTPQEVVTTFAQRVALAKQSELQDSLPLQPTDVKKTVKDALYTAFGYEYGTPVAAYASDLQSQCMSLLTKLPQDEKSLSKCVKKGIAGLVTSLIRNQSLVEVVPDASLGVRPLDVEEEVVQRTAEELSARSPTAMRAKIAELEARVDQISKAQVVASINGHSVFAGTEAQAEGVPALTATLSS